MISIPKPGKEPSFRDAVRKIVQDEYKGYEEVVRRLEADVESLRRTISDLKDRTGSTDFKKVVDVNSAVKAGVSDMRQKLSNIISQQEERIAENKRLIKVLEDRLNEVAAGKPGKAASPPKDLENMKTDLRTFEKNVFEQFDQIHKTISNMSATFAAKSRDFDSMMGRLNRFQDEARALSSENFIREVASMKMRLERLEAAVAELKSREPVVIE